MPAAAPALKPYAAGPKELFALPRFAADLDRSAAATPGDGDAASPECLELPRPTALSSQKAPSRADLPFVDIVWWLNRELIAHGSDIATVRDLYAAR